MSRLPEVQLQGPRGYRPEMLLFPYEKPIDREQWLVRHRDNQLPARDPFQFPHCADGVRDVFQHFLAEDYVKRLVGEDLPQSPGIYSSGDHERKDPGIRHPRESCSRRRGTSGQLASGRF
jgi:hypothetical protein